MANREAKALVEVCMLLFGLVVPLGALAVMGWVSCRLGGPFSALLTCTSRAGQGKPRDGVTSGVTSAKSRQSRQTLKQSWKQE